MFTLTIEDIQGEVADEYTFDEGEFVVGRSQSVDIVLPSDNVSRRHARLYTVDGRCYIEDLNSANGVFVNGRRIHEVYQLTGHAQIKVGDYYLHIDAGTAEGDTKVYARLLGQNLSFIDQVFDLSRTVSLVGRGKDCSLTFIDPSISRIHAKITVERDGSLTVEDLKSSNGTFINHERVEVGSFGDGDILRFGNVEFVVEAAGSGRVQSGGDAFDAELGDQWQPRKSRKKLWITLTVLFLLVTAATVVFVIYGDKILGKETPISDAPELVEVDQEELAKKEAEKKKAEEKQAAEKESLEGLFEDGKEFMKARKWNEALAKFQAIKDIDPVNEEAQRSISYISDRKREVGYLEEAEKKAAADAPGDAVGLLSKISDSSVYYQEARSKILELKVKKVVVQLKGQKLVKEKACHQGLELLRQAQKLDPEDDKLSALIRKTEGQLDKPRRCKPKPAEEDPKKPDAP